MRVLILFFCFISIAISTVYGQKPILPLLAFSVSLENGYNLLEWSSTQDNISYEIEVGDQKQQFETIATLEKGSRVGYYLHQKPNKGKKFYRLKMIDSKGKVSYSPTKEIMNT